MPINKRGNVLQARVFKVKRTDTTAFNATNLPSQSVIVGIRSFGSASDAATTGVLSFGTTSAVNDLATLDVKATAGFIGTALATFASTVLGTSKAFDQQSGGIPIFAKYSETGTASTTGGDWLVVIEFI